MKSIIILLMFLIFLPLASGISTVSVENASAPTGENITLPIKITGVKNLGGIDIWFIYNKDEITIESVSRGNMGDLAAYNIDNAGGVAKMNWFSASGKTGDFIFAYITLKAAGSAGQKSELEPVVKEIVDADGNVIEHTIQKGIFTVASTPQGALPEDAVSPIPKTQGFTSLTFIAVLLFFYAWRKKRKFI